MSEKLCLQWNDFKENITASFGNLRHDEDFSDTVRTVALANEHSGNMQKLDEQINSLMTKCLGKNKHGMPFYICNVCGKMGIHGQMKDHIEANHLEGISVPCNFCDKIFRSRSSKANHVYLYHIGQ